MVKFSNAGVAQGKSTSLVMRGLEVQILSPAENLRGGVPKWTKGADCKSAGVGLRRFESSPLHAGIAQG